MKIHPGLKQALQDPIWVNHELGKVYNMEGSGKGWKIAYYPIFEDGQTQKPYDEPRALVEKPKMFGNVKGIDFREVPLRYLSQLN